MTSPASHSAWLGLLGLAGAIAAAVLLASFDERPAGLGPSPSSPGAEPTRRGPAIRARPIDPASRRLATLGPDDGDARDRWDRLGSARRRALAEAAVAAARADPHQTAWAQRRLSAARADFFVDAPGRERYLELELELELAPAPAPAARAR